MMVLCYYQMFFLACFLSLALPNFPLFEEHPKLILTTKCFIMHDIFPFQF